MTSLEARIASFKRGWPHFEWGWRRLNDANTFSRRRPSRVRKAGHRNCQSGICRDRLVKKPVHGGLPAPVRD